LQRLTV
jgi:hypothetical protein